MLTCLKLKSGLVGSPDYSICVLLQSEKRLVTMTRKDLSDNVLEVEHTEGTERWLVVKTTLKPQKVRSKP